MAGVFYHTQETLSTLFGTISIKVGHGAASCSMLLSPCYLSWDCSKQQTDCSLCTNNPLKSLLLSL